MAVSSTALAEKFYKDFQSQARAIGEAIDADREAFISKQSSAANSEKYLGDIAELQRQVQDAVIFTNSHDQRVYTTTIKSLQDRTEALQDLIKPRGKFSFKSARKPAARAVAKSTAPAELASQPNRAEIASPKLPENLLGSAENRTVRKNVTVSAERMKAIPTASVRGVSQSIVDLSSRQKEAFAGLHVVDIDESIMLCGSTAGGLHITNVQNAILLAQTHQFRMHQCANVVTYLAAGSSPIIEDCKNVKFAPLPSDFSLISSLKRNAWNEVLDFQFPGMSGPSPNWSEVPEDKRVKVVNSNANGTEIDGEISNGVLSLINLHALLLRLGIEKSWQGDTSESRIERVQV